MSEITYINGNLRSELTTDGLHLSDPKKLTNANKSQLFLPASL
jgi:hypothetical protein